MKALIKLAVVCLLVAFAATQAMPVIQANDSLKTPLLKIFERLETLSSTREELTEAYGKLPLSFEANEGQVDPQVKFISRGKGYNLFLTPAEAVLVLNKGRVKASAGGAAVDERAVVRIRLAGSNPEPSVTGAEELTGKSNYFIGKDPKGWRTDIPNYAKVNYKSVYPGIDMVYYGNRRQLEYDFIVSAGAGPKAITVSFEGAERLRIDPAGDLIIDTRAGEIRQQKPFLYQEVGGVRQNVEGRYLIKGKNRVGFFVGEYDRSKQLVIDPVLVYSTFLGGAGNDQGNAITVDGDGNAYVTGRTESTDFPTQSPRQAGNAGFSDAFVTKLNAAGTALVYSTYLGGVSFDQGNEIAVDIFRNAYVTGNTSSLDFPVAFAFQSEFGGGTNDAFVTKLGPAGNTLVFSTYLGGSNPDGANGIAIDGSRRVYVTGFTFSNNFPLRIPLQAINRGNGDCFVTRLTTAGNALDYSTYLGGAGRDDGNSIAASGDGNAYVAGATASINFPLANAFRTSFAGGSNDGFVTKLNSVGAGLDYSTYLGGASTDACNAIAVDADGQAYVTGVTSSTNFPTANLLQGFRGLDDAFVTKFNPTGSALIYSTYLGGSDNDSGEGIIVGPMRNAYVTGRTNSSNFPVVDPLQANNRGAGDGFVSNLNPIGNGLVYSTFLGGSSIDSGSDIAVDANNNAYVTGSTRSFDFPTLNAFQAALRGNNEAFVTKINAAAALSMTLTPAFQTIQAGADGTLTVTFSAPQTTASVVSLNSSNAAIASVPPSVTIQANQTSASFLVRGVSSGQATITATFGVLSASATVNIVNPPGGPMISISPATQTIVVNDNGMLTVTINPPQSTPSVVNLSSSNPGVASVPPSVTIQANMTSASFAVAGESPGSATITAVFGNTVTANVNVVSPPATPTISLSPGSQTIAVNATGLLTISIDPPQTSDTAVLIGTSNSSVVSAPDGLIIPAGQSAVTFTVRGESVGTATITAMLPVGLGGSTDTAEVNVTDDPLAISLTPASQTIPVGGAGTLTVTLSAARPSTTTVSITSTNPGIASAPASVTIPANQMSASLTVSGVSAGVANITAQLPAGLGGGSATARVGVSSPPAQPTISLSPSSQTIPAGGVGILTVTISASQSSDTVITLTSSNRVIASAPPSVTLPAGASSVSFTVDGNSAGTVGITARLPASLGGGAAKAFVTVR